jgi:hypothetical protein
MAGWTVVAQDFTGFVFLVGQNYLNADKPNRVNRFRDDYTRRESQFILSRASGESFKLR